MTDKPLKIALDLTIAGDRMTLDFSRSAPPCDGPLNIARSTTVACCYVALKHLFTDVPANAGCLAPIEFVIPDTTLLGVSAPRPVGGYTETILRVIDTIFGAFAKAAPERANGSPFATINALSLAGWREHGRRWVMFCFFGGGLGGNPEGDGLNHGNNPISTATIPPLEILEVALSRDVHAVGAAAGLAAGPGKHRGGLWARSTRSRRWPTAARKCFCSASAASIRRPARTAAARRRSTASSMRPTAAKRRRRSSRRSPTSRSGAARRCGWKRRAAAASAIPAERDPATHRARRAARLRDGGSGAARLQGARMSVIVGIDVGGTFTDLFRFDSAARTFTTAKVPSRRGDEAQGFLNGLTAIGGAAQRLDRARHHRRHQHAARSGAARRSA